MSGGSEAVSRKPDEKISEHFTWREALWLPQWDRMATEKDGLCEAVEFRLMKLFAILDKVRNVFGKPIRVHCAYRPASYNAQVHGAEGSAHEASKSDEAAVDFDVEGMSCDNVRAELRKRLPELQICVEDLPKTNWVHIDTRWRGPEGWRFFKP